MTLANRRASRPRGRRRDRAARGRLGADLLGPRPRLVRARRRRLARRRADRRPAPVLVRHALAGLKRAWPLLAVAAVVVVVLAVVEAGTISRFTDRIREVQESQGRLAARLPPWEVLGVWPRGDFRVTTGRRRRLLRDRLQPARCRLGRLVASPPPARGSRVLFAALVIFVVARATSGIHVEAKALIVAAPLVMLFIVRGLLDGEARGPAAWRIALGGSSPGSPCSRPCSRCGPPRSAPGARRRARRAPGRGRRQGGRLPQPRPLRPLPPERGRARAEPRRLRPERAARPREQGVGPERGDRLRLARHRRPRPLRLRGHDRRRLRQLGARELAPGRPHRELRPLEAERQGAGARGARRGPAPGTVLSRDSELASADGTAGVWPTDPILLDNGPWQPTGALKAGESAKVELLLPAGTWQSPCNTRARFR